METRFSHTCFERPNLPCDACLRPTDFVEHERRMSVHNQQSLGWWVLVGGVTLVFFWVFTIHYFVPEAIIAVPALLWFTADYLYNVWQALRV